MEAKDKAKELINLFIPHVHIGGEKESEEEREFDNAKDAALACVSKIWEELDENFIADHNSPASSEIRWNKLREYWIDVEREIEKSKL